ncbi:penicillin-binding protein activator, partial [Pseudomonadota bacterium]
MNQLNPVKLTQSQTLRYRMIQARLRVLQGEIDYALEHMLYTVDERLPQELLIEWHTLKADLFTQAGKPIAATRTRIALESLLSDEVAIQRNHQYIWLALNQLTAPALVTQRDQPPPDVFSGWIELA